MVSWPWLMPEGMFALSVSDFSLDHPEACLWTLLFLSLVVTVPLAMRLRRFKVAPWVRYTMVLAGAAIWGAVSLALASVSAPGWALLSALHPLSATIGSTGVFHQTFVRHYSLYVGMAWLAWGLWQAVIELRRLSAASLEAPSSGK
jgi:hypothetical protein